MTRFFDTVMISELGDLDYLETRFREFEDTDTTHVIVESVKAHDQTDKPLYFWESRHGRFSPWFGRWTHVRVEAVELPDDQDAAARKEVLREYLKVGLSGEPDDLVFHGAVSEIPTANILTGIVDQVFPVCLEMRQCMYRLPISHPSLWRGTVVIRHGEVKSFTELRKDRNNLPRIINAGTRLVRMGEDPVMTYDDGIPLRVEEIPDFSPRHVLDTWQ